MFRLLSQRTMSSNNLDRVNNGRFKSSFLLIMLLSVIALMMESQLVNGFRFFPISHAPIFKFRESKMYDASQYVGFDSIHGRIEALGDFNNDQFMDLILSSTDGTKVQVFLWNTYSWKFEKFTEFDYGNSSYSEQNFKIISVIASDFNFDGFLDLMVTLVKPESFSTTPSYFHHYLIGNLESLTDGKILKDLTTDQVLSFDLNGDIQPDLFSTDFSTGKRSYWVNDNTNLVAGGLVNFTRYEQTADVALNPLTFPLTVASIDIDGDCGSDLFVMSCSKTNTDGICIAPVFEFWVNRNGKLQLNRTMDAPAGTGRPIFFDIDMDGDLDMLYTVCYPINTCSDVNEIHILYNYQNSRSDSDLCSRSDFNISLKSVITFPDASRRVLHHYNTAAKYKDMPPSLRVGDFNLDGYPDLVVTVAKVVDSEEEEKEQELKLELWQNIACTDVPSSISETTNTVFFTCDDTGELNGGRSFQILTDGVDALSDSSLKVSISTELNQMPFFDAFFFDIDDNGVLDIMSIYIDESSGNYTLKAFFNNFFNDAYFLKTVSTNGVKPDGTQSYYGVNAPGITIKFTSTTLSGSTITHIHSFLSQTNYLSLETPYNLCGLGRTNGYVEEFYFGKVNPNSTEETINYKSFSSIIPNSQMITVTYPPNDANSWDIQLLVNPSGAAIWVILAEIVSLILLSLPIFALWYREYRQDKKEKEESSREISSVFI